MGDDGARRVIIRAVMVVCNGGERLVFMCVSTHTCVCAEEVCIHASVCMCVSVRELVRVGTICMHLVLARQSRRF